MAQSCRFSLSSAHNVREAWLHRASYVGLCGVLMIATGASAADVVVSGAWFRALPAGLPAGGYFTLKNFGTAVQLTGAASPACGMLMLHKSQDVGGMSSMEDVQSVELPAGGEIVFAPGGYHLMCMAPSAAMKPGGHVPVSLQFSDHSTKTAPFAVKNAAGK